MQTIEVTITNGNLLFEYITTWNDPVIDLLEIKGRATRHCKLNKQQLNKYEVIKLKMIESDLT